MYTDSNFGLISASMVSMRQRSSHVALHLVAVATVTAGSALIDPVFIFEGIRVQKDEVLSDGSLKCLPAGAAWTMTEKGYMTDDAWDKVVVPHLIERAPSRSIH